MKAGFFFIIASVVVAAIMIAGCKTQAEQPVTRLNITAECALDSDCGTGGCSGQVCTAASEAAGVVTTCEYRAEYDCLKLTGCGCVDGKCMWQQNAEYVACLDKAKSQQQQ